MQNQHDLPRLREIPVVNGDVLFRKKDACSRVRMIPADRLHSNQAGVRLGFLNQILQRDFVVSGKDEIRSIGVLAAQRAEGVYSNPGALSRTEQDTPNLHAS